MPIDGIAGEESSRGSHHEGRESYPDERPAQNSEQHSAVDEEAPLSIQLRLSREETPLVGVDDELFECIFGIEDENVHVPIRDAFRHFEHALNGVAKARENDPLWHANFSIHAAPEKIMNEPCLDGAVLELHDRGHL